MEPELISALTDSVGDPAQTLKPGRATSRELAESWSQRDRLALARTFGMHVVRAWWQSLVERHNGFLPLRPPIKPFDLEEIPEAARAMALKIGEIASDLHPEEAAYQIGLIYTRMLPIEFRSSQGIYYTPPALAERLLDQVAEAGLDWTQSRILDPACGGGGFLTPVAQRIVRELAGCSPRILLENLGNRLRGFEIDPFGAWLSQVALDAVLLPISRAAGCRLPLVVTVCDSLRRGLPRERFDLVIGNPPYGRVRLETADRARFKRSLYGHSNLYGLFTDMALRWSKSDGIVAYVTPTSFLAGEYYKNLRALLGRDAPPVAIDFVALRKGVFDDVLQETLLATYRRGGKPSSVAVNEITPAAGRALRIESAGKVSLPVDPSLPWLLPRNSGQVSLIKRLAKMSHRLADWGYTVSTGPLVWNRHKDQLRDRPGRNRHPLIWAEAVTPDGRFVFRATKRNHLPFFETREKDEWLITKTSCVLLQRTTAKEQARRLIAAPLAEAFLLEHGAVVIENHLNMLRPINQAPALSAEALAAFLNSEAADRAFRCVSGSVAVSAYELEALPLPSPAALGALAKLVCEGALPEQIEIACGQLYESGEQ